MDRSAAITVIARAVHEAIRAYQGALGEQEAPAWAESGWMRDSTREAVEFALKNPTAGAQHEAWVAAKLREGWSYGVAKDEETKTHPSMVPFAQLQEAEQRKDAILIAVTQSIARVLGMSSQRNDY